MVDTTAIDNKLRRLRLEKRTPDNDLYYLFDTVPTLHEWQKATSAKVGARGVKSNPELLAIDTELTNYHLPHVARGSRASAIKRIAATIAAWKTRRGHKADTSLRHDAMEMLEEIVTTLRTHVVYDRDQWLMRQQFVATGPDRIPGGFGENGTTVQRLRKSLIEELSGPGSAARHNDSMNEANGRILDAYGLRPGRDFTGGAACFSAAAWATDPANIRGDIDFYTRPDTTYTIGPARVERNSNDTHRYALDNNDIIIDPTWRQFFPTLLGLGTPAIFVGTLEDLVAIIRNARHSPAKLATIYSGRTVTTAYARCLNAL